MRHDVERDLMRINFFGDRFAGNDLVDLPFEFFDRLRAGSGNRLITRSKDALHVERLVQRVKRHQSDGRGAIRVGDDAFVPLHVSGVDFGVSPAAPCRPFETRWSCPLPRRPTWRRCGANSFEMIPTRAEQSNVDARQRNLFVSSLIAISSPRNLSFLPTERAEASSVNFPTGKFAFFQRLDHLDADGARRADHSHMRVTVHKTGVKYISREWPVKSAITCCFSPEGARH